MSTTIIAGNATNNGASISSDTAGTLQIQTGSTPTTAITVDASQNVGIGTTPVTWGSAYKVLQLGSTASVYSAAAQALVDSNSYIDASYVDKYASTAAVSRYQQVSGEHRFSNAPSGTAGTTVSLTERMRIDSNGNLLVGATSNAGLGISLQPASTIILNNNALAAGAVFMSFRRSSSEIGFIDQVGTTSVRYSTTSDYRLKENITPMTGALGVVQQLKPVTYNWKSDGSSGQGFIAHELQAVVPDCVTGVKDAVQTIDDIDAEGKVIGTKEVPKYQGIDTSFLVATLTSAIQEQQAMIEELKIKVAALEAK